MWAEHSGGVIGESWGWEDDMAAGPKSRGVRGVRQTQAPSILLCLRDLGNVFTSTC